MKLKEWCELKQVSFVTKLIVQCKLVNVSLIKKLSVQCDHNGNFIRRATLFFEVNSAYYL